MALLFAGTYLLLVDTWLWAELLAAAAVAAIALGTATALARWNRPGFSPRARWWLALLGLPKEFLRAMLALGGVLLHRVRGGGGRRGRLATEPFPAVGNGRRQVAQRVLAILIASVPPDSVVLGVDLERGLFVVHQLPPRRARPLAPPLSRR